MIDIPVNACVISMLPFEIVSEFPGMIPNNYLLEAAKRDDFTVRPIPDAIEYVYIGMDRSLKTWTPGRQIAGSIVNDYVAASYGTSGDAGPGLKSLPGDFTKDEIIEMFSEELHQLREYQKRWFANLVMLADDTWNDPNARGKQQSISLIQRYAAEYLGLNREWLANIVTNLVQCFACKYNVPSDALICQNCKTVLKPAELAALQVVHKQAVLSEADKLDQERAK